MNRFDDLAIIHNPASSVWYKNSPMGQNKIDNMMKRMVENSPLQNQVKKNDQSLSQKNIGEKAKKQTNSKIRDNRDH